MFVADDRYARDFYRLLTGTGRLQDSLTGHPLVAVEPRSIRGATVLSARGAAPARLTLARFHAAQTCGPSTLVTELVLAFPPGGIGGRTPPSHVNVVALLDAPPASGPPPEVTPLSRTRALELVRQVAQLAESRATLLGSFMLDPDKAEDAGEVIPLSNNRYAVGFRGRFLASDGDTLLVTGLAVTKRDAQELRWVLRPLHSRLSNGMAAAKGPARYSLRGAVTGVDGRALLLVDQIADVAPRDSRATAVDPETGRVVAAQPLALRCP